MFHLDKITKIYKGTPGCISMRLACLSFRLRLSPCGKFDYIIGSRFDTSCPRQKLWSKCNKLANNRFRIPPPGSLRNVADGEAFVYLPLIFNEVNNFQIAHCVRNFPMRLPLSNLLFCDHWVSRISCSWTQVPAAPHCHWLPLRSCNSVFMELAFVLSMILNYVLMTKYFCLLICPSGILSYVGIPCVR